MTKGERIAIILAAYMAVIALFLMSFTGRYSWEQGQNNIHGKDYVPRILDTWTGKTESIF